MEKKMKYIFLSFSFVGVVIANCSCLKYAMIYAGCRQDDVCPMVNHISEKFWNLMDEETSRKEFKIKLQTCVCTFLHVIFELYNIFFVIFISML